MKILVVEDDSVTRLHLEFLLQAFHYEVVSAPNAAVAWQLLADRSIRIVLCDWWMPGLTGPQFCRQIRARGGPYVYFILVSNQADTSENFAATSSAGVDDFISKPVQPDDLEHRLAAGVKMLQQLGEPAQ